MNLGRALRRADAIILQRKLLQHWQLALLRRAARVLIFDLDDAVGHAVGVAAAAIHEMQRHHVAVELGTRRPVEIERLLTSGSVVRDRDTGVPRAVQPGDIAILFRSRESHRELEDALDARGIPSYVYKGLGFFDADEIKDLSALLRYLAAPESNLRAAAFLRSRFVRISDGGLLRLGSDLATVLTAPDVPPSLASPPCLLPPAAVSVQGADGSDRADAPRDRLA